MNYRKLVTSFCNDYPKPVVHGWKNSESSSKPKEEFSAVKFGEGEFSA